MSRKADRAELLQKFKEIKIEAGVYQVRNTVNGKVFIDSLPNLKSINGRMGMLANNMHVNKLLQAEWNEFGQDAFVFEILEVYQPSDNPFVVQKDELKKMEQAWLDKVQPYDERGYHRRK